MGRGGATRRAVPQGELNQILDDLSDLSDKMFTELELTFMAEMRKLIRRGVKFTFGEGKILLDLYRRVV